MRSEFEFINHIKSKFSLRQIGDDCAVIPKDNDTDQVITADLLVEDVDFRLDWTMPEFLGYKALAVSLSDIAAMGAEPKWAMLSIGVPESIWKTDFLDGFYEGWHQLAGKYDVELIGGDISRTPERIVIDSIAGGEVPKGKAFLRSGARPTDRIFVTGRLGGAAGGLKLLESGLRYDAQTDAGDQNLILKQLKPKPHIVIAKLLQQLNVINSAIDISDGLAADLGHICAQSGAGARIIAERIPVERHLAEKFGYENGIRMALDGGEDFELLFTVSAEIASIFEIENITHIGEITKNSGQLELVRDGVFIRHEPIGFKHF